MPFQHHTRKQTLVEPHLIQKEMLWSDSMNPADATIKELYNFVKKRKEIWIRCKGGAREWLLIDAKPGRVWNESFVGPAQFVPAIIGVFLDKAWSTNGDPAPVAGNFLAVNEIGGGTILRCLGAAAEDWVAMHTGGNYPVQLIKSPHSKLTANLVQTDEVFMLIGLVGSGNLETGNGAAWTMPDDGIWVDYDTDVDNQLHFVCRSGGVSSAVPIGAPSEGHSTVTLMVSDNWDKVDCILNGTIMYTHTGTLPSAQLKPIAMIGSHTTAHKDLHLHDYRLIFDRGL